MALSLREFFFPARRPAPSPPPSSAPSGFSQTRFSHHSIGFRFGSEVGEAVARWGSGLGVVDWAAEQVKKDIEDWAEEKAPIIKWRQPTKYIRKIVRRKIRDTAWGVIKGVAGRKDLEAWQSLPVQEPVFERVPEDELSVWEGRLERLRVYEGAEFDDATKREVLNWLKDPQGRPELYESFLRRHSRGTFDEQLLELVESRVRHPLGVTEDPLRRELTGIISRGEEITPELFARLENLKNMGVVNQDVFDFLERVHIRQQFFAGLRNDLGWIEDFYTGRWKRKLFWQAPKKRLLGVPPSERLAKEARARARKKVLGAVAKTIKKSVSKIWPAGKKAAKKIVRKVTTSVSGVAIKAAISSAVSGAIGFVAGPGGALVGAISGPIAIPITKKALKYLLFSCLSLSIMVAVIIILIVFTVGSAFHTSGTGGAPGSPVSIVQIQKTADKTHLDVGAGMGVRDPNERIVKFTITVKNVSDQEITGGKIVSEYDLSLFTPSALGGGIMDAAAGTLTWDVPSLPKGNTAIVNYDGFVDTSADQIVVDKATFSGQIAGTTIEGVATATVVVGTGGTGLNPSGWPLAQGCITQGPEGSTSHARFGEEAVDIAPVNPLGILFADRAVYATHDGIAYAGHDPGGYGNYVTVVSPLGFRTIYAHMDSDIAITNGEQVYPGTFLGNVCKGLCGLSDATHLHYEFDGLNLRMEQPNIPVDVERDCDGRGDCNLCFGT